MLRWLLDLIFKRELIGNQDCPIMYRWYIRGRRGHQEDHQLRRKYMIHYFLPGGDDEDPHDHPRSFWTFVLRGSYVDVRYETDPVEGPRIIHQRMRPGMVVHRPANHLHRTAAGAQGCWTFVVMGRFERDWGFVRNGSWWPWMRYLAEIGNAMLCPGSEDAYRRAGLLTDTREDEPMFERPIMEPSMEAAEYGPKDA